MDEKCLSIPLPGLFANVSRGPKGLWRNTSSIVRPGARRGFLNAGRFCRPARVSTAAVANYSFGHPQANTWNARAVLRRRQRQGSYVLYIAAQSHIFTLNEGGNYRNFFFEVLHSFCQ